jgi:hypothetical protein
VLLAPAEAEESAGARRRAVFLALLVALPGLVECGLYFTLRNGDRPRWREAYACVFEQPRPARPGARHGGARGRVLPEPERARPARLDHGRLAGRLARAPAAGLGALRAAHWFVVNRTQFDDWNTQPNSKENRAELERILAEECELVATFPVPLTPRDLDVSVYVTKPH